MVHKWGSLSLLTDASLSRRERAPGLSGANEGSGDILFRYLLVPKYPRTPCTRHYLLEGGGWKLQLG